MRRRMFNTVNDLNVSSFNLYHVFKTADTSSKLILNNDNNYARNMHFWVTGNKWWSGKWVTHSIFLFIDALSIIIAFLSKHLDQSGPCWTTLVVVYDCDAKVFGISLGVPSWSQMTTYGELGLVCVVTLMTIIAFDKWLFCLVNKLHTTSTLKKYKAFYVLQVTS